MHLVLQHLRRNTARQNIKLLLASIGGCLAIGAFYWGAALIWVAAGGKL
jgi:hypothetical protein